MKNLVTKFKNKTVQRVLLVLGILIIVVGGYLYYAKAHGRVSIEDSLVSAPIINVSSSTGGKLLTMPVYEGEQVKRGDELATLDNQTIYADTDGIVVMADTQTGSLITSQTPIVQLVKAQDFRIAGTLDENKGLKDIRVGQVVAFTVDALPGKTFWGYVDEVSPTARTTQIAFSISSERPTQQFEIYARFNAAAYPQIKNGMSAKMTVFTQTN